MAMKEMNALIIEATNDTPKVVFDPENNVFEIAGNSYPENTTKFYTQVLDWLSAYKEASQPGSSFTLKFSLDYFNTSSAKYILEVLRVVEEIRKKGVDAVIHWYYLPDDSDMLESGQDYESSVNLPFEFIEREDEDDEDMEDFF